MFESDSPVYAHSGKLGTGLITVPVGGILAAVLYSVIYAYIDVYSPVAGVVSLVVLAALGFGLGFTISKLGHVSKCRNAGFLHLVGLGCGFFALYASWVVFEYALLNRFSDEIDLDLLSLAFAPQEVWNIAGFINENGWYEVFNVTPSGGVAWFIWGVEALAIVGGSTLLASAAIDDEVFCEDCNSWCGRTPDAVRLELPEDPADLTGLDPEQPDSLANFPRAAADAPSYVRVDFWECDSCPNTAAVQAKVCTITVDDDGDPSEDSEDLTQIWRVAPGTLTTLNSVLEAESPETVEPGSDEDEVADEDELG